MTRIEFLREQTVSAANKCARAPMPPMDVSEEPLSLPERKALGLKKIFETMPVYIGKRERIVGTRTYYTPTEGNADGHDVFGYTLFAGAKYVNDDDIARFGRNQSYINRTHYTPDFGIVLSRGIDGILADARARLGDAGLMAHQREFLSSVVIAWEGLKTLILRYADEAERLSCAAVAAAIASSRMSCKFCCILSPYVTENKKRPYAMRIGRKFRCTTYLRVQKARLVLL